MKKINGCPYLSSSSGQCTHKACKGIRNGKRYCGYKFPHNCKLFMEWITIKESITRMAKNGLDQHPEEEMI